jgi:hypothetical protein
MITLNILYLLQNLIEHLLTNDIYTCKKIDRYRLMMRLHIELKQISSSHQLFIYKENILLTKINSL